MLDSGKDVLSTDEARWKGCNESAVTLGKSKFVRVAEDLWSLLETSVIYEEVVTSIGDLFPKDKEREIDQLPEKS